VIEYRKGSLFDNPPEQCHLVHACNTCGVWGSGIAVEFKRRFPHAFAVYERNCQNSGSFIIGQFWAIWDKDKDTKKDYQITCLMVSRGYGRSKDSKEDILRHTEESLTKLLKFVNESRYTKTIYSNKFNSGFFAVPWPETEAILSRCLESYKDIRWIVMDPDLKP
jgi:ADP-ribose 1''-phosphate phosphatase